MTTPSSIKNPDALSVGSSFFDPLLGWLRHTFLMGLLISLIGLSGFSISPAFALSDTDAAAPEKVASQIVDTTAKGDRLSALISCLPKQLSQPSFERALSEMGNDQIERILNLKPNPKLSQAEMDLVNCLNRRES